MISYLTQVTICWGLFYLLYTLWLRHETFFHLNRWYLLTTLLAGLFIPLVEFQIFAGNGISPTALPSNYLETITVTAQALENNLAEIVITPVQQNWNIQFILISIYFLGVLFFASRFLYGMFQIIRLAYYGKTTRKQGYFLIKTNTIHLPFSFMDYLFWSKDVSFNEEDHEKILRHELCHIKGKHSIDVLLTELLCIFLWCSPFIFLYKKALKNIHEYLADDAVLQDTPTKKYGQLLLKQSQSGLQIAQANNFIHSQLKKRIIMMTKNKSQQYALLKYTAILPLALFLVFSISAKNQFADFPKDQDQGTSEIMADTIPLTSTDGELFKVVEEMPRFPGCENEDKAARGDCAKKAMLMHIYTNIKYPAVARTQGIEGTVVAKFIIEKDGSITKPEILRKIGGGCDEEVLRIIGTMPNFIPGKQRGKTVRVQYVLPVKYKLEGGTKEKEPSINVLSNIEKQFEAKPLIILDGKEITNADNIDPNTIQEVNVIKGEKAIEKFGEKGKNGVVVITSTPVNINITGMKADNIPPPPPPIEMMPSKDTYKVVEQMPRFPGTTDKASSNKALLEFVYKNLEYPAKARKEKIEGVVVANFVITKEGYIMDTKILRSISDDTDEEVLKVINSMNVAAGKWTPGMQSGKKVNVEFNLPVRFKLEQEEKPEVAEAPKDMEIDQTPTSLTFEKIEVYPNPSSGKINMHLYSETDSPTTITIRDQKGTQLYKQVFKGQEVKVTDLELKNVASGMLYITFEKDGKMEVREVIVQ